MFANCSQTGMFDSVRVYTSLGMRVGIYSIFDTVIKNSQIKTKVIEVMCNLFFILIHLLS